jgi:hypothetical protein
MESMVSQVVVFVVMFYTLIRLFGQTVEQTPWSSTKV